MAGVVQRQRSGEKGLKNIFAAIEFPQSKLLASKVRANCCHLLLFDLYFSAWLFFPTSSFKNFLQCYILGEIGLFRHPPTHFQWPIIVHQYIAKCPAYGPVTVEVIFAVY